MPLTNYCDALVRLNESAFNNIIKEIMLQKPSMFNYATKPLITSNTLCFPINVSPILASMNIQRVTEVDPLPIISAPSGTPAINYCVQIKEIVIDFHPSNQIALPPELNILGSQEIALKGTVCAGIACNDVIRPREVKYINAISESAIKKGLISKTETKELTVNGLQFKDILSYNLHCFCLSFCAKARIVQESGYLKLKVTGIEIQDIVPLGLENSIECYLKQLLDFGILPKMKIALSDLIFNSQPYFSVSLQTVSSQIPFNPDVSNNDLSIFIKIN